MNKNSGKLLQDNLFVICKDVHRYSAMPTKMLHE